MVGHGCGVIRAVADVLEVEFVCGRVHEALLHAEAVGVVFEKRQRAELGQLSHSFVVLEAEAVHQNVAAHGHDVVLVRRRVVHKLQKLLQKPKALGVDRGEVGRVEVCAVVGAEKCQEGEDALKAGKYVFRKAELLAELVHELFVRGAHRVVVMRPGRRLTLVAAVEFLK